MEKSNSKITIFSDKNSKFEFSIRISKEKNRKIILYMRIENFLKKNIP